MSKPLDQFDKSILKHLKNNARLPTSQLATKVNLSRNAVRQRIERMERDGVIQSYTLQTNELETDKLSSTAFIMVFRKDRMRGENVIKQLRQIQEVRECHVLSGDFDLLVKLQAHSQERICDIWQEITDLEEVENTNTCFALKKVIDLA